MACRIGMQIELPILDDRLDNFIFEMAHMLAASLLILFLARFKRGHRLFQIFILLQFAELFAVLFLILRFCCLHVVLFEA